MLTDDPSPQPPPSLHRVTSDLPSPHWEFAKEAIALYEAGHYEEALPRLEALAGENDQFAEAARFPIQAARHVIGIEPTPADVAHAATQEARGRTPAILLRKTWLWLPMAVLDWLRTDRDDYRRCKYCGHYSTYRDPNTTTAYFGNQCDVCRRSYPMPSAEWDSAYGRTAIYERGSSMDREFYQKFEEDYPRYPKSTMADQILGRVPPPEIAT